MVGCAPPILLVVPASVVVQLELCTRTVLLDSCGSLIKNAWKVVRVKEESIDY